MDAPLSDPARVDTLAAALTKGAARAAAAFRTIALDDRPNATLLPMPARQREPCSRESSTAVRKTRRSAS
jgi:hypothetical protein